MQPRASEALASRLWALSVHRPTRNARETGERWLSGCVAVFALLALPVSLADAGTTGVCRFDRSALTFAGTPVEQARCLLRPVEKWGKIRPASPDLSPWLAERVGKAVDVASKVLRERLRSLQISEAAVGGSLEAPVSRARGGEADAPLARYFVIHDTSAPWIGNEEFPADIDWSPAVNNLAHYAGPNAVAHLFVNRKGDTLAGHDLSTPWRATKLETQAVGVPAKGLFLHVELVQPRRRDPRGGPKNDAIAPMPGFTPAQYEKLALLYVVASVRAGRWLVPAFHATLDEGISDAHDDPQHFDLAQFGTAVSDFVGALPAGG